MIVLLEDICAVRRLDDGGLMMVQVLYRVTKGIPRWNHRVTFEGRLDDKKGLLHYLEGHLASAFNLSLAKFDSWALSPQLRATKLWKYSKETMR
jgi:hypothetical protein